MKETKTEEELRAEFEKIFSRMPFEFEMDRNGPNSAWPGNYREYSTQWCWEGWRQAAINFGELNEKPI